MKYQITKSAYLSRGQKISRYILLPDMNLPIHGTIMWFRGGIGDFGRPDAAILGRSCLPFAEAGYKVVVQDFAEPDFYGGVELEDALNDPEFQYADYYLGVSRGAMTIWQLLSLGNHPKAVACLYGLHDFTLVKEQRPDVYRLAMQKLGHEPSQEELMARSGVFLAKKFNKNIPIMLLHGTEDTKSPLRQHEKMVQALYDAGLKCEHKTYQDEHGFPTYMPEAIQEVRKFFESANEIRKI